MIKVLLDTNAMVYSFDKKTDVASILNESLNEQCSLYYADLSINELKRLKRNDVVAWAAKMNLNKVESVTGKGQVDDLLLDLSKKYDFYLLTYDKILAKEAISVGVPIIRMTGHSAVVEK